jgi:hypothetical protein
MGLSVSLGLGRYFSELEESKWEDALRAIVETGSVDRIRDVIADDLRADSEMKVLEVFRTADGIQSHYLPPEEANIIIERIHKLFDEFQDTSAGFSWEQAEKLGYDIQDLAVQYSEKADPMEKHSVEIVGLTRMISLDRSMRFNWSASRPKASKFARAMHQLAKELYLPVHSA